MLMGLSASQRRPKAPIRENGIVVITMMENLGDSNWAAMTTNTRNTAMAMAWPGKRIPHSSSRPWYSAAWRLMHLSISR